MVSRSRIFIRGWICGRIFSLPPSPSRERKQENMKDPRFAKSVPLINGLMPLARLSFDVATGTAGATPTETMIHTTGVLALVFLLLSLAITPARKIFNYNYLTNFRRMLGLFAFFYG